MTFKRGISKIEKKQKQSDTFMNWLEAEQGSLEYSNISNNI